MIKQTQGSSPKNNGKAGSDDPNLIKKKIPLGDIADDRRLILGGLSEFLVEALPPGSKIAECTELFAKIFLRGNREKGTRHAMVQGRIIASQDVGIQITSD